MRHDAFRERIVCILLDREARGIYGLVEMQKQIFTSLIHSASRTFSLTWFRLTPVIDMASRYLCASSADGRPRGALPLYIRPLLRFRSSIVIVYSLEGIDKSILAM